MRIYRILFPVLLAVVTILLLSSGLTSAQPSECLALVQAAFSSLAETCAAAPGNSACFGRSAAATLADGSPASFASPGDVLELTNLQTIQTVLPDSAGDGWGLALLNVHANVPRALSEQGLKLLMLGEVQLENGVAADAAFTPVEAIAITSVVPANLRSAPSTDAQVLGNAPVGTELMADGRTPDGAWVRVLKDGQTAWISRQIVTATEGDIESLPTIGADTHSSMQSFILSTGADSPECADTLPAMLVMQAPGGVAARVVVNGVEIRFDSTIALRVVDGRLRVTALGGSTSVTRLPLPPGFTLDVPLTADGRAAAGTASGVRPITDEERQAFTLVAGALPEGIVYAPLAVPSAEAVSAVLAEIGRGASQTTSSNIAGVDCSRFKPTSPLGSVATASIPFYWDAAQGIQDYRVNIYNSQNVLAASFNTNGTNTSLVIDLNSTVGGETTFSWGVDALVNGQVACTTGATSLTLEPRVELVGSNNNAPPPPEPCIWGDC
ncbi:MAG: SH3 domain-containing protein [Chloroflexi bacterium]|nr:SH3 domain-containing protein [Chloroflexota bacterium]